MKFHIQSYLIYTGADQILVHIIQESLLLFIIFDFFKEKRYRTKLRAIVSNTDYFKPITLKFKTIVYNGKSKIIHNFCGDNTHPHGRILATLVFFRKKASKYGKLILELYVWVNLNKIQFFFFIYFHFNNNNNNKKL